MTGGCNVTICPDKRMKVHHKWQQWNKTHLITALVAYLDAPIEASLMGFHTLCNGGRHHKSNQRSYHVFQSQMSTLHLTVTHMTATF